VELEYERHWALLSVRCVQSGAEERGRGVETQVEGGLGLGWGSAVQTGVHGEIVKYRGNWQRIPGGCSGTGFPKLLRGLASRLSPPAPCRGPSVAAPRALVHLFAFLESSLTQLLVRASVNPPSLFVRSEPHHRHDR
jgi:hypothetical protein